MGSNTSALQLKQNKWTKLNTFNGNIKNTQQILMIANDHFARFGLRDIIGTTDNPQKYNINTDKWQS